MNIAKIHRLYSWDVRGWYSDRKEGIFLSVDPFKEKKINCRPLYMHDASSNHVISDLQFGVVSGRGTDMATSLANDVFSYFTKRGSPVYTCSLDAEGAFDAVPHCFFLKKSF